MSRAPINGKLLWELFIKWCQLPCRLLWSGLCHVTLHTFHWPSFRWRHNTNKNGGCAAEYMAPHGEIVKGLLLLWNVSYFQYYKWEKEKRYRQKHSYSALSRFTQYKVTRHFVYKNMASIKRHTAFLWKRNFMKLPLQEFCKTIHVVKVCYKKQRPNHTFQRLDSFSIKRRIFFATLSDVI